MVEEPHVEVGQQLRRDAKLITDQGILARFSKTEGIQVSQDNIFYFDAWQIRWYRSTQARRICILFISKYYI